MVSAGAAAVTPNTIRSWAHRGHLPPAGLDHNRRPLYARTALARAEKATRARALRLVGISTR
nr:MerR family transcriptional regulator [Streptomyces sp. TRM68416]